MFCNFSLTKAIDIYQAEMQEWWGHHESRLPNLDEREKERVEDITGRIPLLLRALLKLGERKDTGSTNLTAPIFKDVEFLNSAELNAVSTQVTKYFIDTKNSFSVFKWGLQVLTFYSLCLSITFI